MPYYRVNPSIAKMGVMEGKAKKSRPKRPVPATEEPRGNMTTAINLPVETWELLRQVAFKRALNTGGRASVSALLVDLVERQRAALEKELACG